MLLSTPLFYFFTKIAQKLNGLFLAPVVFWKKAENILKAFENLLALLYPKETAISLILSFPSA